MAKNRVLAEGRGAKELGGPVGTGSHVHPPHVQAAVITESSHENSLSLFRKLGSGIKH